MLSRQSVTHASLIIIVTTFLSRVLGLIRELLIAHHFGATLEYDHFLLALTIPLLITNVFIYAVPASYIPVYFNFKTWLGQKNADRESVRFVNIFGTFLITLTIVSLIFARVIIRLYSPSLELTEFKKVVYQFRLLCSLIFFAGVFATLKSIYHSKKHFFLPAIAPLFLNLCIIIFLILSGKYMGTDSLALGFVGGYFIQGVFLVSYLHKLEFKYQVAFDYSNQFMKQVTISMLFILVIELLGQFYVFIDRTFISRLPEGAISSLNYANTLSQIPVGIIGIAIGTAMFPSMSELKSQGALKDLNELLTKGFKTVIVFIMPISFIFLFFSGPIIQLFYQRGAFDISDTAQTSIALKGFSFSVLGFVFHAVLVRTYYVLQFRKALIISTSIAIIVKVVMSIVLVTSYGHAGLAFSTTIASLLNSTLLIMYLWTRKYFKVKPIFISIVKVGLISVFCTGISIWIFRMIYNKFTLLILLPLIFLGYLVLYCICLLTVDYREYKTMIFKLIKSG
jgi:putative peptidoglycan lipid II flippase